MVPVYWHRVQRGRCGFKRVGSVESGRVSEDSIVVVVDDPLPHALLVSGNGVFESTGANVIAVDLRASS
jgi:hypothetical protein